MQLPPFLLLAPSAEQKGEKMSIRISEPGKVESNDGVDEGRQLTPMACWAFLPQGDCNTICKPPDITLVETRSLHIAP
jgi:hypothetical protein